MCLTLSEGVKLTPAEEQDLQRRWERAIGPRFEVVVRSLFVYTVTSVINSPSRLVKIGLTLYKL